MKVYELQQALRSHGREGALAKHWPLWIIAFSGAGWICFRRDGRTDAKIEKCACQRTASAGKEER